MPRKKKQELLPTEMSATSEPTLDAKELKRENHLDFMEKPMQAVEEWGSPNHPMPFTYPELGNMAEPLIDNPKYKDPLPANLGEIDVTKPAMEIIDAINNESDLYVLRAARDAEKLQGARPNVMAALEQRADALRRYGDGSEGPELDIPELPPTHPARQIKYPDQNRTPLFEKTRAKGPQDFGDHDMGLGSDPRAQHLSKAERMFGEMEKAEAKRRMNTADELFRVEEYAKNGCIYFRWGHIMPPQKEVKDPKTGDVKVRFRPSKVFLKNCPRCGRVNRPEQGTIGVCGACDLDIKPYVKTDFANNPSKYPGVILG